MKRFTTVFAVLTLVAGTIPTLGGFANAPAAYGVDFDELRRENLDKDATTHEELRRGHLDGVKAVGFDTQWQRSLEGAIAVDFDELRRENLDKDATANDLYAVDFDELRRENLDKDAAMNDLYAVDFDELRRENLDKDALSVSWLEA